MEYGGGGSRKLTRFGRQLVPSAAEGNPQREPVSYCGPSALFDSLSGAQTTVSAAVRPKPISPAGERQSSLIPFRCCVPADDGQDRRSLQRSRSHQNIRGCNKKTSGGPLVPLGSPRSVGARSGQSLTKRNFGGGGSRTPVRKALRLGDYMRSGFAHDFAPSPQESARTGLKLACFPRPNGGGVSPEAFRHSAPRQPALMTSLSALRAGQRRRAT